MEELAEDEAPVVEAPAVEAPAVEAPAVKAPAVEAPASHETAETKTAPPTGYEGDEEVEALVRRAFEGLDPGRCFDSHVHIIGIGTGGSGCVVNPKMLDKVRSPMQYMKLKVFLKASGVESLEGDVDRNYVEMLVKRIRSCRPPGPGSAHPKCLALAFDSFYDRQGKADPSLTTIHTPNEYVARLVQEFPDCFDMCMSVHPYRRDAITELRRWARRGVRVVKWLPNSMGIDPADSLCIPFYKAMVDLNLTLLTHTGDENSVSSGFLENFLGNPLRLRVPLEHGVRVVAAHCASEGSCDLFCCNWRTGIKYPKNTKVPTQRGVPALAKYLPGSLRRRYLARRAAAEARPSGEPPAPVTPAPLPPPPQATEAKRASSPDEKTPAEKVPEEPQSFRKRAGRWGAKLMGLWGGGKNEKKSAAGDESGSGATAAKAEPITMAGRKENFEWFVDLLENPDYKEQLYGDISAMTGYRRAKYFGKLMARRDLFGRIVHGSDYPVCGLSFFSWTINFVTMGLITTKERAALNRIFKINPMLYDFCLKRIARKGIVELPDEVFLRRQDVFGRPYRLADEAKAAAAGPDGGSLDRDENAADLKVGTRRVPTSGGDEEDAEIEAAAPPPL